MAKRLSKNAKAGIVLLVVVVVVVLVVLFSTGTLKLGKNSTAKQSVKPRDAKTVKEAVHSGGIKAGAASRNGEGAAAGYAAESDAEAKRPMRISADVFVNGETANSDQPLPEASGIHALLAAAREGEGPQTDVKFLTTEKHNKGDGMGINIDAETMAKFSTPAEFLAYVQSTNPALYSKAEAAARQRADVTGINSKVLDRDEKLGMAAALSDLPHGHAGHYGNGRAGSPQDLDRLASAVGETNMQHLTASRDQYETLINKTLVAPVDPAKHALLLSMIHKVTDPGQRATLMAKFSSLSSAMFADAKSAQQALSDGGSGYIAFESNRSARGSLGSIGARYLQGDGGDLAPVLLNYPTVTTVNKERLMSCGGATPQAYEFSKGRDYGRSY